MNVKALMSNNGRPARPQRPMGMFFVVWSLAALGCNILQKKLYVAYDFKFYITQGLLSLAVTSILAFMYAICSGFKRQCPHIRRLYDPHVVMKLFGDSLTLLIVAVSVCIECAGWRIGLGELTMGGVAVIQNMSPAITYVVGILIGVERFSWSLFCAVTALCAGVFASVHGLHATYLGVGATLCSCAANALLWSLIQRLGEAYNAVEQLCMVFPMATLLTLPLAWGLEGPAFVAWTKSAQPLTLACLFGSLVLFAFVIFAKIQVTLHTSSLTTSVSSTFASVVIVFCGLLFFHEKSSWNREAFIGFAISTLGLYVYLTLRNGEMKALTQVAESSAKAATSVFTGRREGYKTYNEEIAAQSRLHCPQVSAHMGLHPQDLQEVHSLLSAKKKISYDATASTVDSV